MAVGSTVGTVGSIWRRATDLADDKDEAERLQVVAAKQAGFFARERVASGRFTATGLVGSSTYQNSKRYKEKGTPVEERAVCMWTSAMRDEVRGHFAESGALKKPATFSAGGFGEQLFVEGDGFDAAAICIGDEFDVARPGRREAALRLQVASPRRPCSRVDSAYGSTSGQETGDSTSRQHRCSRSTSREKRIHASGSLRETMTRPKMSHIA